MAKRHKTGGRRKGTPNKLSGEVRQMILDALEEAGGKGYLRLQARENPAAFMALIGKLVPAEVQAEHSGNVTIVLDHLDADA